MLVKSSVLIGAAIFESVPSGTFLRMTRRSYSPRDFRISIIEVCCVRKIPRYLSSSHVASFFVLRTVSSDHALCAAFLPGYSLPILLGPMVRSPIDPASVWHSCTVQQELSSRFHMQLRSCGQLDYCYKSRAHHLRRISDIG